MGTHSHSSQGCSFGFQFQLPLSNDGPQYHDGNRPQAWSSRSKMDILILILKYCLHPILSHSSGTCTNSWLSSGRRRYSALHSQYLQGSRSQCPIQRGQISENPHPTPHSSSQQCSCPTMFGTTVSWFRYWCAIFCRRSASVTTSREYVEKPLCEIGSEKKNGERTNERMNAWMNKNHW